MSPWQGVLLGRGGVLLGRGGSPWSGVSLAGGGSPWREGVSFAGGGGIPACTEADSPCRQNHRHE